jgi:fructose 1,6-bisphosphatase
MKIVFESSGTVNEEDGVNCRYEFEVSDCVRKEEVILIANHFVYWLCATTGASRDSVLRDICHLG